jgi:transcription antitermination protein NusB
MGVRRDAREAAVQYLYQKELQGDAGDSGLEEFYKIRGVSPSARRFCDELLRGWTKNSTQIDDVIRRHSKNFEFNRLSAVDRNVLRIACHEILNCPDMPDAVAINEAIEIAKKFSTADSGRFVNGVLDSIRKETTPGRTSD